MSVFYIQSHNDWQTAIAYSQDNTKSAAYTKYVLMTDLTFDINNHMFLNSTAGDLDTQYLYIRAGQVFDGNNHTLTVSPGGEPQKIITSNETATTLTSTFGLKGVLRAMGASVNERVLITNLKVVVQPGVVYGTTPLVGSYGKITANYTNFENIIIDTRATHTGGMSLIVDGFDLKNVNFKNIFAYCENIGVVYGCCWSVVENSTFENMILISGDTTLASINIGLVARVYRSLTAKNCYICAPRNTSTSSQYYFLHIFLDNTDGTPIEVSLSNLYMSIGGNYSQTFTTGNQAVIYGVRTTNTTPPPTTLAPGASVSTPVVINLTNIYSNINRTSTTVSNFIRGAIPTNTIVNLNNCQNNFTWSVAPTFSGGGFNTYDTGPYRLLSFMSSPFNPATYTTFDSASIGFQEPPILTVPPIIITTLFPSTPMVISTTNKSNKLLWLLSIPVIVVLLIVLYVKYRKYKSG